MRIKLIKTLPWKPGFERQLFQREDRSYIVISAGYSFIDGFRTFIYNADAEGNYLSPVPIDGSFVGHMCIPWAAKRGEYEIVAEF